jgi:hypothetical protein
MRSVWALVLIFLVQGQNINPQFAANITLYHSNQRSYAAGDIVNMSTADVGGDGASLISPLIAIGSDLAACCSIFYPSSVHHALGVQIRTLRGGEIVRISSLCWPA